jgi:hypothetical protein
MSTDDRGELALKKHPTRCSHYYHNDAWCALWWSSPLPLMQPLGPMGRHGRPGKLDLDRALSSGLEVRAPS